MQYFESMKGKYGFDDGAACPVGIEIFRDIYAKAINRLAELRGSDLRIVPYDRPGCHNVYMVWLVTKEWFEAEFLPRQTEGKEWKTAENYELNAHGKDPDTEADEAMDRAIRDAHQLNLDSYISAVFIVEPTFNELLESGIRLDDTDV